jgi:hypothetical protein
MAQHLPHPEALASVSGRRRGASRRLGTLALGHATARQAWRKRTCLVNKYWNSCGLAFAAQQKGSV